MATSIGVTGAGDTGGNVAGSPTLKTGSFSIFSKDKTGSTLDLGQYLSGSYQTRGLLSKLSSKGRRKVHERGSMVVLLDLGSRAEEDGNGIVSMPGRDRSANDEVELMLKNANLFLRLRRPTQAIFV